jgi:ribonuclease P protein component
MLKAKNRLKLPASWKKEKPDYQIYSPLFKLIAKKVETNSFPKIGFIISGKVGKATVRNRLRRKIAEIIRTSLGEMDQRLEIIFLLSANSAKASDEELSTEINKALSKISFPRQRLSP